MENELYRSTKVAGETKLSLIKSLEHVKFPCKGLKFLKCGLGFNGKSLIIFDFMALKAGCFGPTFQIALIHS